MINYDSILSAFDGKPTLLQWLKMVKKALDESVLKDITVSQDGASAVFTFNFEDGTSISTPAVTLPKGDKGDKGEQGVSVTGVDEVSNEVVGSQTLTTLRFNFSNGTNNEVVVHAENGKNASGGKLYLHRVRLDFEEGSFFVSVNIINTSSTLITDIEYIKSHLIEGTVGYYNGFKGRGAVGIYYYLDTDKYGIEGVLADDNDAAVCVNGFFPFFNFVDVSATEL